jgi:hypothetical protein
MAVSAGMRQFVTSDDRTSGPSFFAVVEDRLGGRRLLKIGRFAPNKIRTCCTAAGQQSTV